MNFYTNVAVRGNKILYRGVSKGVRGCTKLDYKPHFCVSGEDDLGYTNVFDQPVRRVDFSDIKDARDYIKQNSDISNFKLFGTTDYRTQFLNDTFSNDIEFDPTLLKVYNLDIEVNASNGFPKPELAKEEVTAIGIEDWYAKKYYLFCTKDYVHNKESEVGHLDVTCYRLDDEESMLCAFIAFWKRDYPDAITGWNIEGFDIPYLCNRIYNVLNVEYMKRLSPWNVVTEKIKKDKYENENLTFNILGIDTLDYMVIYKKHILKKRENYRLNTIANIEVGEEKISYEEYNNLTDLYEKNPQLYLEYNLKDIELIHRIDDKLKLMDLTFTLAYYARVNYVETLSPVKTWESIIYHHLRGKKKQYAPIKSGSSGKNGKYKGAFVKPPIVGMHKWVVSFDLNSLYPHLIQQFNLGVETIINSYEIPEDLAHIPEETTVKSLLAKKVDTSNLKKYNVGLAANGQMFRNDEMSFFSELMRDLYVQRKGHKKTMLSFEQLLEDIKNSGDAAKITETKNSISKYNNLQSAMKILLNSAYGGIGNQYFQFFDLRIAEAITYSGQLVIQWVEQELNKLLNKMFDTGDFDYCVAIDTDSNYYTLDKLVEKRYGKEYDVQEVVNFVDKFSSEVILPFIKSKYDEIAEYTNSYENRMVMEREVIAENAVWTSKKHYIMAVWDSEGVRYSDFKMKVLGMQSVQSSTPEVCRKSLEHVYKLILQEDEEGIIDYLAKFKKDYKKFSVEQISSPKNVNHIDKWVVPDTIYKSGCPQHTRAAINHNMMVAKKELTSKIDYIKEGTSIAYVALKEPNPSGTYVIGYESFLPDDFGLHKYVDYRAQYEKTFNKPITDMLDIIGYKSEKVLTLDEFFT